MFDAKEIERVVELHQKSYALLRWVNDSLRAGTLSFGAIHQATTLSEAAADWLRRHAENLPAALRPNEADLEPFAHLFVSYLTTSYYLKEEPGTVRVSSKHGCYCRFCSYLSAADSLLVRTPDKKATGRAREMKDLYLAGLARDLGITAPPATREALLSHPTLAEAVTYATYGTELRRRSQFASQGEGILILWREIAWQKGRLKKSFTLSAERILKSETALMEHLRQGYTDT